MRCSACGLRSELAFKHLTSKLKLKINYRGMGTARPLAIAWGEVRICCSHERPIKELGFFLAKVVDLAKAKTPTLELTTLRFQFLMFAHVFFQISLFLGH